ncbi:MAG TPA: hypothetical protein VLF66_04000, partial [Thermoanaerobaculia bacterium]|nr:hypothetical protein [Thermoanaerobaculia bacterium]
MRLRRRSCLLGTACLLAAMLAAAPVHGQHPNHAQGFRPEHVFDLSGLENVDLFNGNLTLTIPIGGSYPVGPELSYGLTLVWTGNLWQWEERPALEGNSYLQAEPRSASRNAAGLGWELSLGRLLDAADPANPHGGANYQSPDQALHPLGSAGTSPNVVRSRDGTYLRHTQSAAKVESPDGTVRLFGPHGPTRIEDPFGNGLTIAYLNLDAQGDPQLWQITDDHGRVQKVFLTRRSGRLVVTRVELTNFQGGAPSVYTLSYSDSSTDPFVPRACNEPVTALFCPGSGGVCGNTSNVQVPILTRVTLPDGSAYSMPLANYRLSETGACPNSHRVLNGQLERLELPTGGALEWDWDVWSFPQESRHLGGVRQGNEPPGLVFTRSAGLTARRHVKRNNQTLGSWTYDQTLHQAPGTVRFTESRTTVTDPLDHTSVHYFSVYHDDFDPATPEPPGWNLHEYGLPFTKRVTDGTAPGRFLSREVFDKDGAHLRSVYVRYERDGDTAANPRMASRRTVYHDDAGRRADLNLSDFDGLGRYRHAQETGSFPGAPTRTTFT